MELSAADRRICRICLQEELLMDWNESLYKFSGTTYKDCYFKYTQIEENDSDPYPQFLCESCSTDLKKCHLLIEKAVETQKILREWLSTSFECLDDIKEYQYPEDVETLNEHEIECVYMVENEDDHTDFQEAPTEELQENAEIAIDMGEEPMKNTKRTRSCAKSDLYKTIDEDNLEEDSEIAIDMEEEEPMMRTTKTQSCEKLDLYNSIDSEDSFEDTCTKLPLKSPRKRSGHKKDKEVRLTQQDDTITNGDTDTKGKTKANTPVMCSFCSKIIHNEYYLKKHEATHKEDREREVTCSKCGLKTFTKKALYIHMKIHDKNREKKFKCEFCDKAFFHRGACNVHRRIHLGQMVKCPICPKEFYRQVDLDRHMQTHSHTPLHSVKPQTKLKYVVHCKECNKEISSTKFNAHRAAHLNEPLMRCTVCQKDFFSRMSCTRHMRRVHKRAKDNYDDLATYYEKYRPRLSHVLMEQQEEVEAKE